MHERHDAPSPIPRTNYRRISAFPDSTQTGALAVPGINTLVLQHTAMFPFQSSQFKLMLKEAGILRRIDRKEICVFPPLP